MALLQDAVAALAGQAGWRTPPQDADGAYRFSLADCPDLTLFSPDDRLCVMCAGLTALPAAAAEREDLLRLVLQRQAGVCRKRASIPALEKPGESLLGNSAQGERIVLYRKVDLSAGQTVFTGAVRDFLNDYVWWKAACGNTGSTSTREGSSFSMLGGMSGMLLGNRY
ncbi:MAG: hypothetical protein IJA79_03435 [Desulfovibrio sp.]|nr:hypothetical protein [Desulfovibrio sp.]